MVSPNDDEIFDRFTKLTVWKRGGQRAPHKPLLVLLTLARIQSGGARLASFEAIEPQLKGLLLDFGPARKSVHPEYPFWRLQKDGEIWVVPERGALLELIDGRKRTGDIPRKQLRESGAHGGFNITLDAALRQRPDLVNRIVARLLDDNFPSSLHEDLLDAVGMPWVQTPSTRRRRDPKFRTEILRIYAHRCAICGYDGRLGRSDLGLEAAHVRWHSAGGADTPDNGLALCAFHHKAFDRGAMGLTRDCQILVSQEVHGNQGVEAMLLRFVGKQLAVPQPGYPQPSVENTQWHHTEVFKAPARKAS